MRLNKHVPTFPIDSGNQEKWKVLSVEIDARFLVICFLLLFRRQTTHVALRHTSERHVRCQVKRNGWLEQYRSQSPDIGCIEGSSRNEFERKCIISLFAFAHFHWLFIFIRTLGISFAWIVFNTWWITSWNFHNNFTVHDFIAMWYSTDI